MNSQKIDTIIEEKSDKYIDIDKYKSFFLKYQSNKVMENVKKLSSSGYGKKSKIIVPTTELKFQKKTKRRT